MTYRKKLIEVALPLEAINEASAREKSIRHGHPSTLHLWWARRPLAACRAVLFSSLVDDPGEYIQDEKIAHAERERLFQLIEKLVQWENTNNEDLLDLARLEIAKSVARNLDVPVPVGKEAIRKFLAEKAPPVLDPFAGGGSIPLEAQRLGLRAYASDLNPVAVLINKALIEIPPRFADCPPVHPPEPGKAQLLKREWQRAQGLADDVRFYGQWMRDEAQKRIGHLYPKVKMPKEYGSGDETVVAWLWARTVKCPNPACGAMMPLARSFWLSTKKGRQAWVEPIIDRENKTVRFQVRTGKGNPPATPKIGRGAKFKCIVCDLPVSDQYIKSEGMGERLGVQLMAVVAEGAKGRIYLSPDTFQDSIARSAKPNWAPTEYLPDDSRGAFWRKLYGLITYGDLFTPRQLVALKTFSDLIGEAHARIKESCNDPQYADAVSTYLAFALDKGVNYWSSLCAWHTGADKMMSTFSRQGLPMVWDFAEANPFSSSSGNFLLGVEQAAEMLEAVPATVAGTVQQLDAATALVSGINPVISTDPPYYDNIGYADLSDFFYVWLRPTIGSFYPSLFSTMLVPKEQELIVAPHRFGRDKSKAEEHFLSGMRKAFRLMNEHSRQNYPTTIFYAFKQSEEEQDDEEEVTIASTGWEVMLDGLLDAGFQITGTWPMRTELVTSLKASVNALASSIVLVCRPRATDTLRTTRRDFLSALKRELPTALRELQQGNIAPVDLAQASIGPGMAVFSRYTQVLEPDGSPMRVRTALTLINQVLDEYLTEQEGEYDADTRWALAWFEQYGHEPGPFGVAETLSRAKNTSIDGVVRAGILYARGGEVRLLRRDELKPDWDPRTDQRLTTWEAAQYLIRKLDQEGEQAAAALLHDLGAHADPARDLAYRLYTICERKNWAQEALGYNMLVVAWPRLVELAAHQEPEQGRFA